MSWMLKPRKLPYKCFITNTGEKEVGPFYEIATEYKRYDGDPPLTMYISRKAFEVIFNEPKAPYSLVDAGEVNALKEEIEELRNQLEEEKAKVKSATDSVIADIKQSLGVVDVTN